MRMLIATNNKGKLYELREALAAAGIEAVSGADLGIEIPDTPETGSTFEENAALKARDALRVSGLPSLADDSGLEADALNGAPGVYSARYSGVHGNDGANIAKLLDALKDVSGEKRSARFVCAICAVFPDGREIVVRGTWEGKIAASPRGNNGFGYDPVFLLPDGRTAAELDEDEKSAVSHRAKAIGKLVRALGEE